MRPTCCVHVPRLSCMRQGLLLLLLYVGSWYAAAGCMACDAACMVHISWAVPGMLAAAAMQASFCNFPAPNSSCMWHAPCHAWGHHCLCHCMCVGNNLRVCSAV